MHLLNVFLSLLLKKKVHKFNTVVFPILYHIINIKITQLFGHIGWNVYSSPEFVLEDNGPVLLL